MYDNHNVVQLKWKEISSAYSRELRARGVVIRREDYARPLQSRASRKLGTPNYPEFCLRLRVPALAGSSREAPLDLKRYLNLRAHLIGPG